MKKLLGFSSIIIFVDQIVKILIDQFLILNIPIKIIPNFFNFLYVRNNGAAFSILQNSQTMLIISSTVALVLIYELLLKGKELNRFNILTTSLLIGGIIGNLIDRIFRGYVIDYLSFLDFPVFNIADICIVVGCFLLVFKMIKER